MKRCAHRWVEKDYKGQICVKCKDERGMFLPGARKPQWYKGSSAFHAEPRSQMNRYAPVKPGQTVSPDMKRLYRMECCDCGLVHKIRFQVIRETERRGKDWKGEPAPKKYKVVFQSWRDGRATAARRRLRSISRERK